MPQGNRRGVTRGYVVGLVGAVTILSLALLVAAWGGISLATGVQPVRTGGVPFSVAPVIIVIAVLLLVLLLWSSAIALLRGQRSPPLVQVVIAGFGAYLVWCMGGLLMGMSVAETWLSPFPVVLAGIWGLAPLVLWAVLIRRVYTDRRPPRWPWESHPAPDDLQYPDHPVDPEDGSPGR